MVVYVPKAYDNGDAQILYVKYDKTMLLDAISEDDWLHTDVGRSNSVRLI